MSCMARIGGGHGRRVRCRRSGGKEEEEEEVSLLRSCLIDCQLDCPQDSQDSQDFMPPRLQDLKDIDHADFIEFS